jgi:hypothetical protein
MRYWVYPSPIKGTIGCLIVPENTLINSLPDNIQAKFRDAQLWRTIELDPKIKHVGFHASEVLRDIKQKGYHIAAATIKAIEQWPGRPGAGD